MDTLLIPTWRRAEFLHECLTNLVATGDLDSVHVILKPDEGFSPEVFKVWADFQDRIPHGEVLTTSQHRFHKSSKQSRSVLEGYRYAAEKSTGMVFLVEEDIMVAKDFFRFHRALHQKDANIFCSLSPRNHNRDIAPVEDPGAYYLSTGDYCSWGVAWRREVLLNVVLPHACEEYYRAPWTYCGKTFPNDPLGNNFSEQDGLIRRIQRSTPMHTAYPHVPRAYHAGFHGYNRRQTHHERGTLEQRIQNVQRTIYDPVAMRAACLNDDYFRDSKPENLNPEPWTSLHHLPVNGHH
jgi:hypothetical protein